ncbi:MAG: GNAT family N-acetyltransferase [Anaerolineae bacterium]
MDSRPLVTVRQADARDARGIARVWVDTWRSTYRGIVPEAYLEGITYAEREAISYGVLEDTNRGVFAYVAESDGQIVGFAAGGPERSGDPIYLGELYAIYILEAYQGQGIGRALVREAAGRLARGGMHAMLVWVLAENAARSFYERLGGRYERSQEITIGGVALKEVAYGWRNTRCLWDTGCG